ncbi:MAG: phosphatidylglycerophosphatase A [Planctomycetota bacterium]|nr:phosphatidylglycerophosphatase A [Planctomycetota bacterium]
MNILRLGIVSCGFLGCSPFAPGTVGTLGGVAIAWALAPTALYPLWILVAIVGIYLIGRSLGTWAEEYAGKKDPGIFVLDEVIGYLICVLWLNGPSLLTLVVAFFVFRFFDIVKPRLARRMETIPGGDGILLDDVVAGLYGLVLIIVPARLLLSDLPWSVIGTS